ncbi:endothelin-converting enzyme homolog isoform X2 [Planococcus citri]|uniref:endothelin-converting enzyme homolog isoform X2 n=1 Tax=Planococcus citri TaxID=170843 RepID=UPI0031F810F9
MSSNPELFGDDRPGTVNYYNEIPEEDRILPLFTKQKKPLKKRMFKGPSRALYRNRKRITRRMTQLLIIVLLVYSIFMIYKLYFFKRDPFCTSESCQRAESEFLKSTDFEVNPCQNFYKYACGNWDKHNTIPPYASEISVVQIVQNEILKKISQFLSQTDSRWEPKVIHETRKFYQSCMKTGLSSSFSKEYVDFGELLQVLSDVHLPMEQHIMNTSPGFSWFRTVALSKSRFDRNFFFEFDIVQDPKNHVFNRILISKPTSTSIFSSFVNDDPVLSSVFKRQEHHSFMDPKKNFKHVSEMMDFADVKELSRNAYHKYIRSVYKLAYDASNRHWSIHTEKEFNMMFVLLMLFSSNLDRTMKAYPNDQRHLPKLYTIDSLQKMTDGIFKRNKHPFSINWKEYLQIIFKGTNVTLDFEHKDNTILISHDDYLISVLDLISKTPPYTIESYLWWETVHSTLPYINCKMNEFSEEFSHKISGLQPKPRELFCAEMTNNLYGFATAYFLANNRSIQQKTSKVNEISDNIQTEFANTIKNLKWLDNSTKTKALRKLNSMTKHVGYPETLQSTYDLDKYYENTTCSPDNFLENVVNLKRQQMMWKLTFYRLRNDDSVNEGWYSRYVLHTNAYYVMEKNSMVIPAGLFSFPFHDSGLEAMNYGSIGMVIGHELTHGFDNTGKHFDEFGRINKWWSKSTEEEYQKRAKCFIHEYDSYNKGVIRLKNALNGTITLNENIADNGGVQLAYYAYKNYVKRYGPEQLLPRLKYFTPDQLFFLSFAHTWCEHRTRDKYGYHVDEPHSPHAIRVLASLKNFPEFSKAWGCKKGTPMNPDKVSCQLW